MMSTLRPEQRQWRYHEEISVIDVMNEAVR